MYILVVCALSLAFWLPVHQICARRSFISLLWSAVAIKAKLSKRSRKELRTSRNPAMLNDICRELQSCDNTSCVCRYFYTSWSDSTTRVSRCYSNKLHFARFALTLAFCMSNKVCFKRLCGCSLSASTRKCGWSTQKETVIELEMGKRLSPVWTFFDMF